MTKEEMFDANIKLAYKIANKYLINYLKEYEDIKQIALLGLWKAVLTFKHTHAFSTYAYAVISNEINQYLRNIKKYEKNISINMEIGENITVEDTLKEEVSCIEKMEDMQETKRLKEKSIQALNMLNNKEKMCVY